MSSGSQTNSPTSSISRRDVAPSLSQEEGEQGTQSRLHPSSSESPASSLSAPLYLPSPPSSPSSSSLSSFSKGALSLDASTLTHRRKHQLARESDYLGHHDEGDSELSKAPLLDEKEKFRNTHKHSSSSNYHDTTEKHAGEDRDGRTGQGKGQGTGQGKDGSMAGGDKGQAGEREGGEDLNTVIYRSVAHNPGFYIILLLCGGLQGSETMSSLGTTYLLKDDMRIDPSTVDLVSGFIAIPWIVKPLWGFMSDGIPIFGYRRKGYLFISSIIHGLCWLHLAFRPGISLEEYMAVMVVSAVSGAFISTVIKAMIVEHCQGKSKAFATFLQTFYYVSYYFFALLSSVMGGFLLEHYPKQLIFGITSSLPFLLFLALPLLRERNDHQYQSFTAQCSKLWHAVQAYDCEGESERGSERGRERESRGNSSSHSSNNINIDNSVVNRLAAHEGGDARGDGHGDGHGNNFAGREGGVRKMALWQPMLFFVLFASTPSTGSSMFYFNTEVLGFSEEFIASTSVVGISFSLVGILIYSQMLMDVSYRKVLLFMVSLSTLLGLLPIVVVTHVNRKLGIPDQAFVMSDTAILSVVGEICQFPLLILGSRICPPGVEASLYALLMSLLNLGSSISKEIGALLAYSLGITRTSFGNMWLLCLICVLCNPLPLLLLDKLVPQEGAEGRTETGNGNGNGNGNDIGQGRGNGRGLEQGEEEGGLGCGVQRGNGVHRRDRIENGRALGAERV